MELLDYQYILSSIFTLGSIYLPYGNSEELYMQIIAPERTSTTTGLKSAVRTAIRAVNMESRRQRNPLREAGLYLNAGITFTDRESPTPEEIVDLFCDKMFRNNASVIMSINYGELTSTSNAYILNIAKQLGYPVISWDPFYPGALESDESSLVLQIGPTVFHQCRGIIEILERYNWTDFSIVTSARIGRDFIDGMAEMVRLTSITQGYLIKPRFTNIATVVIDFQDEVSDFLTDAQTTYVRHELQTLVKVRSRVMLLHTKSTDTLNIFEVAESMGLTGSEFVWVLTSSGIGSLVSRGTSLPLGLLAVSPNSTESKIQEAIHTAITVWSHGLKSIVRGRRRSKLPFSAHYDCTGTGNVSAYDGRAIYNAMKDVVLADTLLPPVSFSANGIIEHVSLDMLNTRPGVRMIRNRPRKIKTWDDVGRIFPEVGRSGKVELKIETNEIVWPALSPSPPIGRPEKRFFRVVTKQEHPYMMYRPPDEDGVCGHHEVPCTVNGYNLPGNSSENGTTSYCCTGLCVEVLGILADRMNFEYELYDVPDGQWGVEIANGTFNTTAWTGLLGEIVEGRADLIMTAFLINQIRSTAVDFSVPFLESGITIMVSIRKGAISPYAFLEPYDFYSWILILIFSVHATGASIFIFEWLSPSGLVQGKGNTVENKFSLFRSFWLIWAMLFGAAVSIDVPRGVSSRFLSNVWALFALVFLASYTANLAAFMITIDEYFDLSGIEDWRLIHPTKLTPHFKFATVSNSSTDDNLRANYPRMHKYMAAYNQSDVAAAKMALKTHKIHAFIYDANVLEYTAGRDEDCSLLTVGRWYAMSGYGIGLPMGSDLLDEINEIILDLQHNGEIERLQAFWQSGACHAMKDKKDKSSNKIGILNFISAFYLLACGVLLGLVLLTLEHLYFKSGRKCVKKYDKCGCCTLVSLSMGKSLTFKQSVFEAIDIQKRHKCTDPVCEMHLWKAKHQLDMALIKVKKLEGEINEALSIHRHNGNELIALPSTSAAAMETVT